jgi:AcrR family transcriptional regulator
MSELTPGPIPLAQASVDNRVRREYRGVSADERQRMRHEAFVKAGLECFGRRGLPDTTIRDVCAHARQSERYFYDLFGSLHTLFAAVYEAERTVLLERLVGAVRDPFHHMAAAEAGLRTFFAFVREDPRRVRILLIDGYGVRFSTLGQPEKRDPVFARTPYVSLFGGFLKQLYPQADALGIDVALVHQMLIGMAVRSAISWMDKDFAMSLDDVVRHNMFAWKGFDQWVQTGLSAQQVLVKGDEGPLLAA